MNVWKNVLIQLGAIAANVAAVTMAELPPDQLAPSVAVIQAAQAIAAVVAHYRNPNGAPVAEPYIPPARAPRAPSKRR